MGSGNVKRQNFRQNRKNIANIIEKDHTCI